MSINSDTTTIDDKNQSVEYLDEQLQRIKDEESWNKGYFRLALKQTFDVWGVILLIASTTFAIMNFIHGYHGSITDNPTIGVLVVASSIGLLYASVEYIIPLAAHAITISWSKDNKPHWFLGGLFRLAATIVFVGGMLFSWMILQGNFSLGSDVAKEHSDLMKSLAKSDSKALPGLEERSRLLGVEIATITRAIEANGRSKKWRSTNGCTNATIESSKLYCRNVKKQLGRKDALVNKQDLIDTKISKLKAEMSGRKGSTRSDKPNKTLSWMTGFKEETLDVVKPTLLATIAALITHIGWALKSVMSNMTISTNRNSTLQRKKLEREVKKAKNREVDDIAHKAYLDNLEHEKAVEVAKQSGVVASLASKSPLPERPLWMQIGQFIEDTCIRSEGLIGYLGAMHEVYGRWASENGCVHAKIDRFKVVLEDQLNYDVTSEGKVVGVALKSSNSKTAV